MKRNEWRNRRERVGQNYWFESNHRNFLNSWWMLNYLSNHHESLPSLVFLRHFIGNKVSPACHISPSCAKIDIRTPSVLCMYSLIAPASIVLDRSPGDRSDGISLLIFHRQDFLRVLEITCIHAALWSPLIKKGPAMPSREKIITREI